jgi:hypothetical protein
MLVVTLVLSARFDWWEFEKATFNDKIQKGIDTPIFAVCFLPACPLCRGIKDRFMRMASSVNLARSVVFTAVNCSVFPDVCTRLDVRGFPTFAYISSTEASYWDHPGYQDPDDWAMYIRRRVRENLIDESAVSPADIVRKIEATVYGSVVIQMSVSDSRVLDSSGYARKSLELRGRPISLMFTEGQEDNITAWLGPDCSVSTSDIADVSGFLDRNKFGHFHNYTEADWAEAAANHSLAILFAKAPDWEILRALSKEFCGKMMIGWSPTTLGNFSKGFPQPCLGVVMGSRLWTFQDVNNVSHIARSLSGTRRSRWGSAMGLLGLVVAVPIGYTFVKRFRSQTKAE